MSYKYGVGLAELRLRIYDFPNVLKLYSIILEPKLNYLIFMNYSLTSSLTFRSLAENRNTIQSQLWTLRPKVAKFLAFQ